MKTTTPPTPTKKAFASGGRRWVYVYFLLAAFDLATVSISLSLNHRIAKRYADSVIVNKNWSDRQGVYANLGSIAAAVNAPGNNVFATMNIDQEEQTLREQAAIFRVQVRASRRELLAELSAADAKPMVALLDDAQRTMEREVAQAEQVFTNLRAGNDRQAGAHMAQMDRLYNTARDYITELDARVRLAQRHNLDRQARAALAIRRFELVIAGLIVLMVLGVTTYGRLLVRQAQHNAQQREAALAAIAQGKAKIEAIVQTASEGILTVRDGATVESANPAAGEIFGCPPATLIGRHVESLLAPGASVDPTPGKSRETLARRASDVEFPMELSISQDVELPGGAVATWIVRDISHRKHIEAELTNYREHLEQLVEERTRELEASSAQLRTAERLASIGTLAAGLGHDLKNLLFPMRCRLDLIEKMDVSDQASEEIASIRSSLDYLHKLSQGLRLLSLNPDDADASTEFTNIADWWDEVGALLTRSLPEEVAFEADLPEGLAPVAAPAHLLTQAALNLIVNAGEAIEGAGRIRLSAVFLRDQDAVEIVVQDTGVGMTPEVLSRALDPFFTTKKRGLSTGLGLSLVHAAVRSAGGEMRIDSTPGAGTTITLSLPTTRAGATPPADDSLASEPAITSAVVSISDPRLASFAVAVAASAGVETSRQETLNGQSAATLWITDLNDDSRLKAAAFIAAGPRHRVITLGEKPDDGLTSRGALHITPGAGVGELRQTILRALNIESEPAQ